MPSDEELLSFAKEKGISTEPSGPTDDELLAFAQKKGLGPTGKKLYTLPNGKQMELPEVSYGNPIAAVLPESLMEMLPQAASKVSSTGGLLASKDAPSMASKLLEAVKPYAEKYAPTVTKGLITGGASGAGLLGVKKFFGH